MSQEQDHQVGLAISVVRQLRPPGDSPKSISGLWKYFPGKYQCIRLVPTNVCKWRLIEVYRDLFYFSDDCAIRAGIGIAQNTGLPFILGLKHNKTASKSDLLLLNPTEFD